MCKLELNILGLVWLQITRPKGTFRFLEPELPARVRDRDAAASGSTSFSVVRAKPSASSPTRVEDKAKDVIDLTLSADADEVPKNRPAGIDEVGFEIVESDVVLRPAEEAPSAVQQQPTATQIGETDVLRASTEEILVAVGWEYAAARAKEVPSGEESGEIERVAADKGCDVASCGTDTADVVPQDSMLLAEETNKPQGSVEASGHLEVVHKRASSQDDANAVNASGPLAGSPVSTDDDADMRACEVLCGGAVDVEMVCVSAFSVLVLFLMLTFHKILDGVEIAWLGVSSCVFNSLDCPTCARGWRFC